MAKVKGITIELGLSDKSTQKPRTIPKHCEALANELDAIDNAWQCECGSDEWEDTVLMSDVDIIRTRKCLKCGESYYIDDSLPTRLEGSD